MYRKYIGTSQSRQSLGQTHEEVQYWVRARKTTGEEEACHILASRERIARERE
jgi:hypothetical protein